MIKEDLKFKNRSDNKRLNKEQTLDYDQFLKLKTPTLNYTQMQPPKCTCTLIKMGFYYNYSQLYTIYLRMQTT